MRRQRAVVLCHKFCGSIGWSNLDRNRLLGCISWVPCFYIKPFRAGPVETPKPRSEPLVISFRILGSLIRQRGTFGILLLGGVGYGFDHFSGILDRSISFGTTWSFTNSKRQHCAASFNWNDLKSLYVRVDRFRRQPSLKLDRCRRFDDVSRNLLAWIFQLGISAIHRSCYSRCPHA